MKRLHHLCEAWREGFKSIRFRLLEKSLWQHLELLWFEAANSLGKKSLKFLQQKLPHQFRWHSPIWMRLNTVYAWNSIILNFLGSI